VLYTSNNLEKVITGSVVDTGSDGDVNTISSCGEVVAVAPIENYPENEGPDDDDSSGGGGGVTTQQPVTDQTNVYSEFPIGEEASTVIPGSEMSTESDAVTATPWESQSERTTGAEQTGDRLEEQEGREKTAGIVDEEGGGESGGVIVVDDYPEYDDNNGRDETTQQQDNSSVNTIMQFANISQDDSQVYQANTTGAPSGGDNYEDETVKSVRTQLDDTDPPSDPRQTQGPPRTPLLTLMQRDSDPQKLIFLIQRGPRRHSPDTKVHLMYQRLPASVRLQARPQPGHLHNPVIKVFSMVEARSEYEMEDLLTGQYLVCAEVRLGNASLQSDCAQAVVNTQSDITSSTSSTSTTSTTNSLGLPIMIAITAAGLAFLAVVSYTVYSLVVRNKRMSRERDFQRKVEEFARRERDRNEKFENSELSVTYPDPNEPFEERCIM